MGIIINRCPCDCSGTLNTQRDTDIISAIICPQCDDPYGSSVTITNINTGAVVFQSTIVNPSSCITTTGGTTLVASGEGVFNSRPVVFTIFLHESIRVDWFELNFRSLFDDGDMFILSTAGAVLENELTISECPSE